MIKKCRQIWICNRRRYLTWKKLLAKAATIKRFENSPLGTEIKKKTDIRKTVSKIRQGSWIQ